MIYAYESDPQVVRYVCYGPSIREECSRQLAFHILQQIAEPRTFYHLAVVIRDTDRVVGWCGLELTSGTREAELGYALHRVFWGRGYMTEAALAMLAFGFQELQLHRIFGTCHPANTGSIRVLEKFGMRGEGLLRENKWWRDHSRDTCIFAVLDHE